MTDDATPATATDARPADVGAGPFARLIAELSDLAYEPCTDTAGVTVYTATDSPTTVLVDTASEPARVALATAGGTSPSEVTVTAGTPDATQLLILYAVLNPDPAAAIAAAANALGVAPPA